MEKNCTTCEQYATCSVYTTLAEIQYDCADWIPADEFTNNIRNNEDDIIKKLTELIEMADKILERMDHKI
ncbi:MAG: hypothetical protein KAJ19_23845 [Gammaproteobacteria bacterium]|nr:hypothetical protein [Gammaproteobacteria bacterium]